MDGSVRSEDFVAGRSDAVFWAVPKEAHPAQAGRASWRAFRDVVLLIAAGRANPATHPHGIADE